MKICSYCCQALEEAWTIKITIDGVVSEFYYHPECYQEGKQVLLSDMYKIYSKCGNNGPIEFDPDDHTQTIWIKDAGQYIKKSIINNRIKWISYFILLILVVFAIWKI